MDEIDITTTQNITINYELASFFERTTAFVIDLVVISISCGILYAIFSSQQLLSMVIILPVVVFYSLIFELLNNGQSLGKMAMKLRVIRMDGDKTVFKDYLMRWMFRVLDIYGSFGSIAFLGIVSSSSNQRTGDLLADTVVVSLKKSNRMKLDNLLKLNNKKSYVPLYPQVVKLDENTMLLVKEVLKKHIKYKNDAHEKAFKLLVEKIEVELDIKATKNKTAFLQTLLNDYIFLTR